METDPQPAAPPKRIPLSFWVMRGIYAAAICVLGGMVFVQFRTARIRREMQQCQENLVNIEGRKAQWALENNKHPGDPVTEDDLVPPNACSPKPLPNCLSGSSYILNPIGTDPVCTSGLPGHSEREIGLAITELER